MWKRTHTTKSGGYVEGTSTQEFMVYQSIDLETFIIMTNVIAYFIYTFVLLQDIAESRVNERFCDSKQPREAIETEVFNEMMYQQDKPNQRVVDMVMGLVDLTCLVLKLNYETTRWVIVVVLQVMLWGLNPTYCMLREKVMRL